MGRLCGGAHEYQAFLYHFVSVGGWLEGSWGGWVCGGVGVGGVGCIFVRDGGAGMGEWVGGSVLGTKKIKFFDEISSSEKIRTCPCWGHDAPPPHDGRVQPVCFMLKLYVFDWKDNLTHLNIDFK